MKKRHIETGTKVAMRISFMGLCLSAILVKSNSLLSSLTLLQPYEFKADTLKAYLFFSLSPFIIHEVSKKKKQKTFNVANWRPT